MPRSALFTACVLCVAASLVLPSCRAWDAQQPARRLRLPRRHPTLQQPPGGRRRLQQPPPDGAPQQLPPGLTQQTRRSLPDPNNESAYHATGASKFMYRWVAGTYLDFRSQAGGNAFEPGALCAQSRMSTACAVRRPVEVERDWTGVARAPSS